MATDPLLPVIDYTSRDYEALRSDMIRLIRARIPQWTAENPSDFGVALVEAMAYATDGLHYYLDRVANEAYLPTAVQRESVYAIADMFRYRPRRATPAQVYLSFRNATQADVLIPAGTRVQASVPGEGGALLKNFEVQYDYTIPAATAVLDQVLETVLAIEGRTYKDEPVGISNGYVGQRFFLPRTSVLEDTIRVTVQVGDAISEWEETDSLDEFAAPDDRLFETITQTDGSTVIRFGDGLHGEVPGLHGVIRATYRVGGGTAGNVPANSINTIVEPVIYGVSVSNEDPASGGQNPESLPSIRINASRSYRARDRAVTLSDYESLAVSGISQVAKAKGIGNNGSSVTVYAAPVDDGSGRPTMTPADRAMVTAFLSERAMAGVTVQVFDAAFVPIYLSMTATCSPTSRRDEVERQIREQLDFFFRYQNVDFDQTVSLQEIYYQLSAIPGLEFVQITRLNTTSAVALNNLVMGTVSVNAIPFFRSSHVETGNPLLALTMSGGI